MGTLVEYTSLIKGDTEFGISAYTIGHGEFVTHDEIHMVKGKFKTLSSEGAR